MVNSDMVTLVHKSDNVSDLICSVEDVNHYKTMGYSIQGEKVVAKASTSATDKFEEITVAELLKLTEELGLNVPSKAKKAVLQEALTVSLADLAITYKNRGAGEIMADIKESKKGPQDSASLTDEELIGIGELLELGLEKCDDKIDAIKYELECRGIEVSDFTFDNIVEAIEKSYDDKD